MPNIKIEMDGNKHVYSLMQEANCIIHCYDSTGILESMNFDIPTFCIWPNKLIHLQSKYYKFFMQLKKNEILYFDIKKIVNMINKNYPNFDNIWLKKNVQKAKNIFLNQFSIIPKKNSTLSIKQQIETWLQD